jgi:Cdc6-like AAA superfamily ATPase
MTQEQKVFFAVAKAVRKEQENRKAINTWAPVKSSTSQMIHIHIADVYTRFDFMYKEIMSIKQIYAILYKLQEKGLIKIHEGFSGIKRGKTTKVSLDVKGIEYIKSLKEKSK